MEKFASVDVMLGSISARTFLGYAPVFLLSLFSWLHCLSQKAPPVQRQTVTESERERESEREQRKGGRKTEGVTSLLVI